MITWHILLVLLVTTSSFDLVFCQKCYECKTHEEKCNDPFHGQKDEFLVDCSNSHHVDGATDPHGNQGGFPSGFNDPSAGAANAPKAAKQQDSAGHESCYKKVFQLKDGKKNTERGCLAPNTLKTTCDSAWPPGSKLLYCQSCKGDSCNGSPGNHAAVWAFTALSSIVTFLILG